MPSMEEGRITSPPTGRSVDAPTWREALLEAFAAVDAAYERRAEVVIAAHDAGLSIRTIAEVVGTSATSVHRIIGTRSSRVDAATILDSPAAALRREGSA